MSDLDQCLNISNPEEVMDDTYSIVRRMRFAFGRGIGASINAEKQSHKSCGLKGSSVISPSNRPTLGSIQIISRPLGDIDMQ